MLRFYVPFCCVHMWHPTVLVLVNVLLYYAEFLVLAAARIVARCGGAGGGATGAFTNHWLGVMCASLQK